MLLTMTTTLVWAQTKADMNVPGTDEYNRNNKNNNNNIRRNNNRQSRKGESCAEILAGMPVNIDTTTGLATKREMSSAHDCEQLAIIAAVQKNQKVDEATSRPTADGKIVCDKVGGFTTDFDSCKKVSLLYDAVLIAEQGMIAAQKITQDQENSRATQMVAQKTAAGDGQNAAIDAIVARNELNEKLFKQQALAYGSAVAAIGTSVGLWKSKKAFAKECNNDLTEATKFALGRGLTFDKNACTALFNSRKDSTDIFANDNAKNQFLAAVGAFAVKAAEANKRAGLSEFVADKIKKSTLTEDVTDTVLDPCMNSTAAECANTGSQGNFSSGTFQGNTVGFGTGTSNGFDFNATPGVGDLAADAPTGVTDNVADVISPFEDQAKAASGILNPAGAATLTPGGENSPGGGGGAGGGGGGGSASLGDDLAGATADGNKDPDIATNKLSGKYKGGKAGGFQAVAKGSKDEVNPYASLFDNKAEGGGIEEDRSIASDSGEGSGLFQKISRKYGQIQQEKRIDNPNLE